MQIVSIREILRSHKQVLARVKQTKERFTIVSQEKPQAGIVSLEDLKKLEELDQQERYKESTKSLINTAHAVHKILADKGQHLPSDLSNKHDYYHYEESEEA